MPPQSRTQPQSSKKTREFRNMMRRPNMHIGVHYPRQAEEYGVTNNSMVLAGESKHRYETIYSFFQSHFASWITKFGNFPIRIYKDHVQRTNKREVEKTLLQQESFRRTLILLLDGAFADEPKLSNDLRLMYTQCPLVFSKLPAHICARGSG
jgi:hypothetical protein